MALTTLPISAQATVFEFTFTGEVDRTNAANNDDVPNIGELNIGDAVSGSFTYDGGPVSGGAGTFGSTSNVVSDFEITVDGFLYTATGTGGSIIYDNHMPGSAASITDAFFASSGSLSGADQGGLAVNGAQFSIGSILDLTILNSLNVPTLSEFQSLIAANSFDGNTNILGFGSGDDVRYSLLSVSVSALPPVPLPAAGFMLIAGLAGLGALRRCQKTS